MQHGLFAPATKVTMREKSYAVSAPVMIGAPQAWMISPFHLTEHYSFYGQSGENPPRMRCIFWPQMPES